MWRQVGLSVSLLYFIVFAVGVGAAKPGREQGVALPDGLNLRIQKRKLGEIATGPSPSGVFGELQLYSSAFLYFPAPYTVQDGDSLEAIAFHSQQVLGFEVSAQAIREMNSHLQLPADDVPLPLRMALNVPGYPAVPPAPTTLSVSDSSTLLSFLQAYGIPVEHVEEENPGLDISAISSLTTVRVPDMMNYPVPPCPHTVHCVVAGETLADAAQHIGQPVEELLLANEHVLRQGGRLFIGQALSVGLEGPATVPSAITVKKFQNPYEVLLSLRDMPLTPLFLSKLSKANNLSMAKLLTVKDKDTVIVIPALRKLSDLAYTSSDETDEEPARVLEEIEPVAPLATSQPIRLGAAVPAYHRRALHPLLKATAVEDDDAVPMRVAPITHAGARPLTAKSNSLRATAKVEDHEDAVVSVVGQAHSSDADSQASTVHQDAVLTADYIKQFARTVFGVGNEGEDDIETSNEVDINEAGNEVVELGSMVRGDRASASAIRAAAKLAMQSSDESEDADEAGSNDLVIKLLGVLKEATKDARVEQLLEEFSGLSHLK